MIYELNVIVRNLYCCFRIWVWLIYIHNFPHLYGHLKQLVPKIPYHKSDRVLPRAKSLSVKRSISCALDHLSTFTSTSCIATNWYTYEILLSSQGYLEFLSLRNVFRLFTSAQMILKPLSKRESLNYPPSEYFDTYVIECSEWVIMLLNTI